jgi:hypothetical protein
MFTYLRNGLDDGEEEEEEEADIGIDIYVCAYVY